ncbi:MAG TPA: hypothetical protein VN740_02275 [Solirubrobacteraceae bacterium]|nr:hypothetical protein [Solirubrobacteraceae bacterium]
MPTACPATPAGLGSTRSRRRATGCEHRAGRVVGRPLADGHRRLRSERPLRSSRSLLRAAYSC